MKNEVREESEQSRSSFLNRYCTRGILNATSLSLCWEKHLEIGASTSLALNPDDTAFSTAKARGTLRCIIKDGLGGPKIAYS